MKQQLRFSTVFGLSVYAFLKAVLVSFFLRGWHETANFLLQMKAFLYFWALGKQD